MTAESNKKNSENFINCRNLDIDEIQKMKIGPNSPLLFHKNSCSLKKKLEHLEYLLKDANKSFDVIAISESRIPEAAVQSRSELCFATLLKSHFGIDVLL